QAIDDDCNQTGQLLAAMLDWPQGTFASRVQLEDGAVRVEREGHFGVALSFERRVLISSSPLPSQKAKKKPLEVIPAAELGVSGGSPRLKVLQVQEPPARAGGEKVENVATLVEKLRQSGRV
ncbi:ETFB protein, partial [Rhagologus leucostigma]|nr:ETFB protein [Rhagologus leucostigma]